MFHPSFWVWLEVYQLYWSLLKVKFWTLFFYCFSDIYFYLSSPTSDLICFFFVKPFVEWSWGHWLQFFFDIYSCHLWSCSFHLYKFDLSLIIPFIYLLNIHKLSSSFLHICHIITVLICLSIDSIICIFYKNISIDFFFLLILNHICLLLFIPNNFGSDVTNIVNFPFLDSAYFILL